MFLAVTFGQEVRWCYYQSSHLTKNGIMDSLNWSGWAPYHISRPQQDGILNSGQYHPWSLMAFLYISVRSLCYKRIWQVALNSKYYSCATWEYYTLCMSSRLTMCIMLLLSYFLQSASTCCVCPFANTARVSADWRHTEALPTLSITGLVSILHWYLSLSLNWPYAGVSEVFDQPINPIWNNCNRCEIVWSIWSDTHRQLGFPGDAMYFTLNWMGVVVNAMLGGKLRYLSDIGSADALCKRSWLLDYMPCIGDPETCSSFSLQPSWLLRLHVEWWPQ
jgi:hypothetical protein